VKKQRSQVNGINNTTEETNKKRRTDILLTKWKQRATARTPTTAYNNESCNVILRNIK